MSEAAGFWDGSEHSVSSVPLESTIEHLLVLDDVLSSPAATAALTILRERVTSPSERSLIYRSLWRILSREALDRPLRAPGDGWQQHLVTRLLESNGTLAQAVRRQTVAELSPTLLRAAQHDLMLLSRLYHLGADGLRHRCPDAVVLPPLPGDLAGDAPLAPDWSLRQLLDQQQDWSGFVSMLAEHYRSTAMGDLAHGTVFRWLGGGTDRTFKVINHPDPVRLADLVGDERQRELIIRNTKHFLAGLPANNVLLYGDRGTGKSSTVKALVNEFATQGLRLIEVPRQRMEDFPEIVEILRTQPHKYVLFVDDLSFEEQETTYKDLKALLEGGVEIRPTNVVVYATSNRRHLIRERHADRPQPGEEEVHSFDTVQEQLSLADRFGITITFLTPDQEQYLAIVRHLAGQRQLPIAVDELRTRALQWASWHNGRSGRSAHQFVDYLAGELLTRATPSALS